MKNKRIDFGTIEENLNAIDALESCCWECGSTKSLKVIHEGVALCLCCRIKEFADTLLATKDKLFN